MFATTLWWNWRCSGSGGDAVLAQGGGGATTRGFEARGRFVSLPPSFRRPLADLDSQLTHGARHRFERASFAPRRWSCSVQPPAAEPRFLGGRLPLNIEAEVIMSNLVKSAIATSLAALLAAATVPTADAAVFHGGGFHGGWHGGGFRGGGWHGGGWRGGGGWGWGPALGAGILGGAIVGSLAAPYYYGYGACPVYDQFGNYIGNNC
jgi:hypothetical protein